MTDSVTPRGGSGMCGIKRSVEHRMHFSLKFALV
jgi:hypothetical protein